MKTYGTDIQGVFILEPQVFGDDRGYFFESFSERDFRKTVPGIRFVQDNESRSRRGVVRGLHFQMPPYAQSKLVRVVEGKILDVAVDLRKGSPTFGEYVSIELSGDNHRQLFIPKGCAHGFSVLSDEAVVAYKCDEFYHPECEGGVAWNDPEIGIGWGFGVEEAILSEKDRDRPLLKDFETPFTI